MKRRTGPSTTAIHGTPRAKPAAAPIVTPIFQSTTFANAVGATGEVLYTRYGNNPNQIELGERLAALEGADAAMLLASGMGATALAHLAILNPGDHLLSSDWIYGGTRRLFDREFRRLGIDVSYVDPSRPRLWKGRFRRKTRAVFVETPTNPLVRVIDLEPLGDLCRARGVALVVDSTFASPINMQPLAQGADVVIHSATKYLNGHTDVIGGVVAGSGPVIDEIRSLMQVWGQSPDPNAAWLIARGLKTLAVRMERHNINGMAFARWASGHRRIRRVHYPGLEAHPDHELATRTLRAYGGMVGLEIKGGVAATERMLRRLRLASHAPSLGGVETLVSEPRLTSHAEMTVAERAAQGIPNGFVRVSLGIEDVEDIVADFARALGGAT